MNYTTEQIQKAFEELPEELQNYIVSDAVQDAMNKLVAWFEIIDSESFRQGVSVMLVGLGNGDGFIQFVHEKLNLSIEDAENLFNEVGNRILEQAHVIFEKAVEQAKKDAVPEAIISKPAPVVAAIPAPVVKPNTPPTNNRLYATVPFYGVERPASSYTSILPQSKIDLNKTKDTATGESLMKKVGMLAEKPENKPIALENVVLIKKPTVTVSQPMPSSNLPMIETQPVLPQPISIQLSKMPIPLNMPPEKPKPESKTLLERMAEATPAAAAPKENIPKPIAPVNYTAGQDPYREAPTP